MRTDLEQRVARIRASGKTIYEPIDRADEALWIPSSDLQEILAARLVGESLAELPLRTRSKVAKTLVTEALGYPAPSSFKKVQPRFPCQDFDVYTQKSNNLQIWNEELSPARRYVLLGLDQADTISAVRVVNGDMLANLDTTGTLTQKYQARMTLDRAASALLSPQDTERMRRRAQVREAPARFMTSPSSEPTPEAILPVSELFNRLRPMVGEEIAYLGAIQERNRGSEVHRRACELLGYGGYSDNGQFPDVRHQLLEIKLQTSPTIDLGLVLPSSTDPLDIRAVEGVTLRHCDVRYAVFSGTVIGERVSVDGLYVVTGADFLDHFQQFGGKELNKKLQIPLPADFFA